MINHIYKFICWWLRKEQTRREYISPHLDRHNDYIIVYLVKNPIWFLLLTLSRFPAEHIGYTLTDGGNTIYDLHQEGCYFSSKDERLHLNKVLKEHGVKLNNKNELRIRAKANIFDQQFDSLISAIIAIKNIHTTRRY